MKNTSIIRLIREWEIPGSNWPLETPAFIFASLSLFTQETVRQLSMKRALSMCGYSQSSVKAAVRIIWVVRWSGEGMGLCQSQVGSFPQQALVSKAYARRRGVIRFAYETQINIYTSRRGGDMCVPIAVPSSMSRTLATA